MKLGVRKKLPVPLEIEALLMYDAPTSDALPETPPISFLEDRPVPRLPHIYPTLQLLLCLRPLLHNPGQVLRPNSPLLLLRLQKTERSQIPVWHEVAPGVRLVVVLLEREADGRSNRSVAADAALRR